MRDREFFVVLAVLFGVPIAYAFPEMLLVFFAACIVVALLGKK